MIGHTPGPTLPTADTSPSYDLDELYGDYFSAPEPEPGAPSGAAAATSYERDQALTHLMEALDLHGPQAAAPGSGGHRRKGSATIVHISQKLTDPQWLIPSRPAPAPPARPRAPLVPTVIVTPPADEPQAVGGIMAREVQRQLLLLSHETSAIARHSGGRLVRHLHTSNALGDALASALGRLDRVARLHGDYDSLAEVLPAVRGVLAAHMAAVIDQSRALPAPQLLSAVQDIPAARHARGLYLVVAGIPFSLPLALQALEGVEAGCAHGPTVHGLMLSYRAFKEQAARLPPGGDPRLRINLPHKYYLPYATPGQVALAWGQHANTLWARYQSLCAPQPGGAQGPLTAGPTAAARSPSSRRAP